jgi:hypothetical protein
VVVQRGPHITAGGSNRLYDELVRVVAHGFDDAVLHRKQHVVLSRLNHVLLRGLDDVVGDDLCLRGDKFEIRNYSIMYTLPNYSFTTCQYGNNN